MPTWTSQVIRNDPNILAQKQQDFNNLMGAMNQFAGVMYNIKQAKQAEDIKKLSIVAEGTKFVPKDQLPEYFNQNFIPLAKKFGIEVNPLKVNPDNVKELSDKVLLALKDPNPATRMVNLAVIGQNSGLADEGATLVKNLTEAVNQQNVTKNVGILKGLPQQYAIPGSGELIEPDPFSSDPLAFTPDLTEMRTPTEEDKVRSFANLQGTKLGQEATGNLTPKEKTGGKWFVNADTGERKTFYPNDKMTGNWYELGGQTKPDKETLNDFTVFYKAGKLAGKTDTQISKDWEDRKIEIAKLSRAPEKPEKLTMTDVRSAYSMDVGNIKNRMMVDMTPEEQANISGQPAENVLALILSGKIGRSLSPEKKAGYIKELRQVESYYSGLTNQVLGRKGAKPPIQSGSKSGMSSLIDFFKGAKTKEDAIGRIKSAIKQGWTKEQLQKAERQTGWAW